MQSELHENESQGCGGSFAACADDEARFAEEEGVTVGIAGGVVDEVRGEVGTGVFDLDYLSVSTHQWWERVCILPCAPASAAVTSPPIA